MAKTVVKPEVKKRELIGKVVSTKNTHTVIVAVEHTYRHPLYKKAVKTTRKFAAHNEIVSVAVGDTVSMIEIKPMSKTKHFMVKAVVTK